MSEVPARERIAIIWSPEARAVLRAIDRETARQNPASLGDYRVFFDHTGENAIRITGVRHRREAYR